MRKWWIILIGVIIMIFALNSNVLYNSYNVSGVYLDKAYDADGNLIYPDIPVPSSGDMTATYEIELPDIYGSGHGFTCTGLAYDSSTDTFLIGDFGEDLPSGTDYGAKIIRMTSDFSEVVEQIPLSTLFPDMGGVQGITIDITDGTIWFCSPDERLIRHITAEGASLGSFSMSAQPTGIAYSPIDDAFWVLTYASSNNILKMSKTGTVTETYSFAYTETLDQCFLDPSRGILYMTAGVNYSSRNNVYTFNTSTHAQGIACAVDSYSVEGIWLGDVDKMIIVNDGYYHSAAVPVNQANIYIIDSAN